MGHITTEVVGLISIGLSTYLILYSHQIFKFLSPALEIFQRSKDYSEVENTDEEDDYDVVILGLGRFGRRLAEKSLLNSCLKGFLKSLIRVINFHLVQLLM